MQESEHIEVNRIDSVVHFIEGTVLLIDKPHGWTSFDVVNRIKGYVRRNITIPLNAQGDQPRFKIGHAGTLDPLATGLLVICTGKFTKKIDQFQGGEKQYTGVIRFGQTTPSYDLETAPEGDFPTSHLNLEVLREEAKRMTGEQWQKPPVFSAKQVDGKRAYASARKGIHVEIPPSRINVAKFEILDFVENQSRFLIDCSKGTYIRTLAHDIGQRLQSGSHLTALRRTASAPFGIERALTMNDLMSKLDEICGQNQVVSS
ncbi:MAG: tRNA pseudouridine(55) synthase TruB [Flavobacteriales bacterium]|nr:tRNA pseudouridine(55) synthase TruB [Flavobacteriales bacterium]